MTVAELIELLKVEDPKSIVINMSDHGSEEPTNWIRKGHILIKKNYYGHDFICKPRYSTSDPSIPWNIEATGWELVCDQTAKWDDFVSVHEDETLPAVILF